MASIGINIWVWTAPINNTSLKLLNKVADMGFDTVELPLETLESLDGKKVAAKLKETGLKATVCGAFSPDRDLTSDNAGFTARYDATQRPLQVTRSANTTIFDYRPDGERFRQTGSATRHYFPAVERDATTERCCNITRNLTIYKPSTCLAPYINCSALFGRVSRKHAPIMKTSLSSAHVNGPSRAAYVFDHVAKEVSASNKQ